IERLLALIYCADDLNTITTASLPPRCSAVRATISVVVRERGASVVHCPITSPFRRKGHHAELLYTKKLPSQCKVSGREYCPWNIQFRKED
ncbi:hypothetical protein HN51_040935, partial [Arachis hypogaea]